MKKILMLVVALMCYGSVSASGQEVTIEAIEWRYEAFSAWHHVTFRTNNNTDRTVVAWRGRLVIKNPFGDIIWSHQRIFGDESDIPPRGTDLSEIGLLPNGINLNASLGRYNLGDYQFKDLNFTWTDIQVAYGNEHKQSPNQSS